ncbi:MAG: amino acid synthesis family protein [Burkholderiales bacterium]|nr:amino acid synthesis family protein [Burkholderiales bacterium]
MTMRQIVLIDQEVRSEGARQVLPPTRRVAACAVIVNPFAGAAAVDDHALLVDLSFEVGALLTARVLKALDGLQPCGYGKAALVGTAGDLEHGAAMIHVRAGLAMRNGIARGLALIPGNAKVAAAGTAIDVIFGGIDDAWDYDAMDTMPVALPDAPRPNEIVFVVAFLAGGRPNARIKGAPQSQVTQWVRSLGGQHRSSPGTAA